MKKKALFINKLNLVFFTFLSTLVSCSLQEKVDLIVHNANIYTVDEGFSKAGSFAVKDGKIIAIGTNKEILNNYVAVERYNALGKPIYPGFIDAHCHFYQYGIGLSQVDLTGTTSFEDVISKVILHHKKNPSEWIVARGWDQTDWKVKILPNKLVLDSLFPYTPVLISRVDGHAALANSEALKRAGITSETKIQGGIIELMSGTEVSGILIDNAIGLVRDIIPFPTEEQKVTALLAAQKDCFSVGLTTVDDAGLDKEIVELIDRLQKSARLKMRIYAMLTSNEENLKYFLDAGPFKTEWLNVRSFKFYADGSLGSRSACLLHPYSDRDHHYGLLLNPEEFYRSNAKKLFEKGFQMNTHCIGDSANQLILKIYGEILKTTNDYRWRIEHAQVLAPEDFKKFAAYTVIPSVQPTHATSDMYWAEERVGPDRLKGAYAYKDLLRQNGIIASGSDFPVESINPLLGFYAAIARKDFNNAPQQGFLPDNALTAEEALKAMTIWAAMSNFEENEKGSLEVGKFADFVILEKDIMEIPPEEIPLVKVVRTYVNGEKVY